ncbi:MAG: hypothetical protein ACFFBV_15865, partial [Promethearchaeota archaeon]
MIFIAADSVSNNGTIRSNGGSGTSTGDREGAGGGGSGGSILIQANSFTNSATFTATGGTGGARSSDPSYPGGGGGSGGVGRIRIEADTINGTTDPTASTAGIPGTESITVVDTSYASNSSNTITIPHTVSGSNRLLLVGVSINNDDLETVTSVTWKGTENFEFVGEQNSTESPYDDARIEIWKLVNPSKGTDQNVVVTLSATPTKGAGAGAVSFTGVDQDNPLGTFASAGGNYSSPATKDIPSASGEMVFGVVCSEYGALSNFSGDTEHWNQTFGTDTYGAGGTKAGAAPNVTMSWDVGSTSSNHWAIGGVSVKPASSGATFMADQDTAISDLAKSTTARLRLEVSNEGGASSGSVQYRLEYATSTSGPWTAVPASATTEHWQMSASTYITDGEATSDIAGGLTNENTTFVAGELKDTGNTTSGITLSSTQFTEIEYSIEATTNATDNQTYYFRVTNAGSTTNFTYTVYPQVTMTGPVQPLLTKVDTFAANSGTGNQSVSDVGFQPKAVFFWITDRTSAGSSGYARFGRGWTDGTNMGAVATAWDDSSGSSTTLVRVVDTKCITLINQSGTLLAEASIVSLDSNGFTINWSTAGGSRLVTYLALGGNGLTNVKVGSFSYPQQDNYSVTDVGFQPDTVLFMGAQGISSGSTMNTNESRGGHGFGIALSSTDTHSDAHRWRDGSTGAASSSSGLDTSYCLVFADDDPAGPELAIEFVSMDSGGFSLTRDDSLGNNEDQPPVVYLAMKGMDVDRGVLTQPTSTGNQSVADLSFEPSIVLFDGGDKATTNGFEADAEMVAGVATSSSARASFWIGCDSDSSPYPSDTDLSSSAVIRSLTAGTPSLNAQADFVSMNSDGFTINWTTADSTQRK